MLLKRIFIVRRWRSSVHYEDPFPDLHLSQVLRAQQSCWRTATARYVIPMGIVI